MSLCLDVDVFVCQLYQMYCQLFFSGHEVLVSKVEDDFSQAREMCHSLVS